MSTCIACGLSESTFGNSLLKVEVIKKDPELDCVVTSDDVVMHIKCGQIITGFMKGMSYDDFKLETKFESADD